MFQNKVLLFLLTVILLLTMTPVNTFAAMDEKIDKSFLDKGIITIHYPKKDQVKTVIQITKDEVSYVYNLVDGGSYPLPLGNGKYTIFIGEAVKDNLYKVIFKKEVDLNLEDDRIIFLQSSQLINWTEQTKAVIETKKIIENASTDKEKVEAVYTYIINNIQYDYDKVGIITSDYIPNLDEVFESQKGICYDYAAVMAAMLRSIGIPTRLVMGTQMDNSEVYHAWNEIFLKDINKWITVDATYDAIKKQAGEPVNMIQDPSHYTADKTY